ncbi:MAG TPA: translation elongation factor Ts [Dehalococcoidia bacterium]|nr:translation elongation factor Ts [Dehalococcoidia bacterium]
MAVSAEVIRALREQTGAGIMDCKRALEDAQGDQERAAQLLRERGIAIAEKKASRATSQGLVDAYIHAGGRIGALVELNCETDFVARTEDFRQLAHDLAMQVAATSPLAVGESDLPAGVEGDPKDLALLSQPFIKDPGRSVGDLVRDVIAKTGENIVVRRFARFELGGDQA